ncbi:MAG: hypothetical protein HY727_12060 [Candidatus Rokubacteria bacterium]|nr:hypothetical protein [Candidatus Rokubacteria bacterium]
MTDRPAAAPLARCRGALEAALARGSVVDAVDLAGLGAAPDDVLDQAFRGFATDHGPAALPLLAALASPSAERAVRRAARRALYRLAQRGTAAPPRPAPRPVVERRAERAARAFLSGIDGTGARATWIVFEDGYGGRSLCSLLLNDTAGIVEAAGGAISKKRLESELASLRAAQKLPWVDVEPARAVGLVVEALALHAARGTAPPAAFARWQRLFAGATAPSPEPPPADPDPRDVERSPALLDLPEMAGWFLDPDAVQADALELLESRESRLVVADQIKAEREEAIVTRVVERAFSPEVRRRWARRLGEMGFVLEATARATEARLARAAAGALAADDREPARHPLARALARRALDLAAEVTLGRVSAADVSRKPTA